MVNFEEIKKKSNQCGCLVIGDIILDKYIYGEVNRISPEAPIPVLRATKEKTVLGGAANVSGNVKGYHIKTFLCGLLGNDKEADDAVNIINSHEIVFLGFKSDKRRTTIKTRVIGMNQQLVRIDQEDTFPMSENEERILLDNIRGVLAEVDSVILSDYNKGVCTETFCESVINICNEYEIPVIVDPKSTDWSKYKGAYLVTPNFKEFKDALGYEIDNEEKQISKAAQNLLQRYEMNQVLVTRSQYGMTLVNSGNVAQTFQTVQQEVFDVSGAGDTVIGTIASMLALQCDLNDAVEISNYAAGLSVSKSGTYMVTLEEVMEYMELREKDFRNKIVSLETISELVSLWKKTGEKIVFTNGCFDILHIGHVEYMNKASKMGTKMIVGVNSDSSVKRLKGESRPINSERIRTEMLAALQCVDAIVVFEEDTPYSLIKAIEPDYLVKGGDYKAEEIVGREFAENVVTIPLTAGYSTTNIINKIKTS